MAHDASVAPLGARLLDCARREGALLADGLEVGCREDCGCWVYAKETIPAGTLLISTPGNLLLRSNRIGYDAIDNLLGLKGEANHAMPTGQDTWLRDADQARLVLRLLLDPPEYYKLLPLDYFSEAPLAWPAATIGAFSGRGSAYALRLRDEQKACEEEFQNIVAAFQTLEQQSSKCFSFESYVWAKLCVQTRAFICHTGHCMVPVIDLVNHAYGRASNAIIRRLPADGAVEMASVRDIMPGEQVYICYDGAADFLDLWFRYGFFDKSCTCHTAEIVIDDSQVSTWGGNTEEVLQLLHALGERVEDADGSEHWLCWIDLYGFECPLIKMLRCAQLPAEEAAGCAKRELDEADPLEGKLANPLPDEMELVVHAKLQDLLRARLGFRKQSPTPCNGKVGLFAHVVVDYEERLLEWVLQRSNSWARKARARLGSAKTE